MSNVDLSQLAVDRGPPQRKITYRKRGWLSRYVLPLLIVSAFAGLLGWAAKDSLLPRKQVTVVPVFVARAEVQQVNTPLFQAAGWLEPRPVPVVVSSLADGVIEKLLVVAGQRVRQGETIAQLIDVDARIALAAAQAELKLRDAEVAAARGELQSAKIALEKPIQLQADLAEADSALAEVEADLNGLPSAIAAARTQNILAEENIQKKLRAGDAVAGRVLREAKGKLASAKATSQTLQARLPVLERQREALLRRRDALAEKLELKLEEQRRVTEAAASVQAAEARQDRARLAVDAARLRLERMTITSPIDGRVLSVQAPPGRRVNGIDPHSEQGSSAVVTLYDPEMLQARVDVRLEDVPNVQLGQRARIETASVSNGLDGQVISVTSQADIQKNTLQVKVAITDPPDVIRPEMLAQVTFLAPERPNVEGDESEDRLRLLVPRQLIAGGGDAAHVWVADLQMSAARRRSVTLGRAGTEELVEILSGLTPTDKLISGGREGIAEGQRIRVVAEDAALGIAATGALPSAAPSPRTAQRRTARSN